MSSGDVQRQLSPGGGGPAAEAWLTLRAAWLTGEDHGGRCGRVFQEGHSGLGEDKAGSEDL